MKCLLSTKRYLGEGGRGGGEWGEELGWEYLRQEIAADSEPNSLFTLCRYLLLLTNRIYSLSKTLLSLPCMGQVKPKLGVYNIFCFTQRSPLLQPLLPPLTRKLSYFAKKTSNIIPDVRVPKYENSWCVKIPKSCKLLPLLGMSACPPERKSYPTSKVVIYFSLFYFKNLKYYKF